MLSTTWTSVKDRFVPVLPLAGLFVLLVPACSGSTSPAGAPKDRPSDPGQPVTPTPSDSRQADLLALQATLAPAEGMDAASLASARALPFASGLGYDPLSATNLALVQGGVLKLGTGELDNLGQNGFVISRERMFSGFAEGYATIYALDLPVFISADSILHALHRSYDKILAQLERDVLRGELTAMFDGMRAGLGAGALNGLGAGAAADADLYLAVAKSLLDGQVAAPVAGASAATIQQLFAKAKAASGSQELVLLGASRTVDFSQFAPRGHYAGVPLLESYFQTMMWLGRMDLPILDVDATTGETIFRRRMLEAAVGFSLLLDDATFAHWKHIDDALRAFVGEPDAMEPPDVPRLLADLQVTAPEQLAAIPDAQIAQAMVTGAYGQQAIASQIIISAPHQGTLPLAATYLLMGQRYVVDSHVFSNVVYDRSNRAPTKRMMPDPLDVAFAALGNDAALPLLSSQLTTYAYAPDLERTRRLVDAHGDSYWGANLYNAWLGALRALSPTAAGLADTTAFLPAVARTEPWSRRVLNTQLASWAELRHDTVLYVKQSYTSGVLCEFPDAYVEPVPAFYDRLALLAQKGTALVGSLDLAASPTSTLATSLPAYFDNLAYVAHNLGTLAQAQLAGTLPTAEQLAFVNQVVKKKTGTACGMPTSYDGWYPTLFFANNAGEFAPTIADVHTQPTDEGGAEVGRVLHVGTGRPREMVVTIEACDGPRAYVGLASSYYETITQNYQRLTDNDWEAALDKTTTTSPAWQTGILGP
jgi:hypothetical protein